MAEQDINDTMTLDRSEPEATASPPLPRKRRFIDYPRGRRTGWTRWIPSWRLVLGLIITGILMAIAALALAVALVPVPKANQVALAQTTTFYWDDNSSVLGHTGEANRTSVPLDQVPLTVQHAVLSAEDRDFYQHSGFSVTGIARAAWHNVGGSTEGGSTITQQYAKNAFLTQDQTIVRKVKELVLAMKLETTSSKDDILIDYLNTVYYGRGAYGIEAAAKAYFGVSANQLTTEQGAMLAALLQAPNGLAPEKDPAGLQARWNYVLDGMVEKGWLDASTRSTMSFPVVLPAAEQADNSGPNGYLLQAANEQLAAMGYSPDDVNMAGLQVKTTFDRQKQDAAVAAVAQYDPGDTVSGLRIGLAAVKPGTGEVEALYGGKDYQQNQFNNATQARGQGGSTFKPFGLAAGLENGITLDTSYSGASPMTLDGYTLENYDNESYGRVSMLYSTVHSINTPFVQMNEQIGPDKTQDALVRAGIPATTPGLTGELNNVLGSASPTPVEEATAYATLAAGGKHTDTTMISEIRSASGTVLFQWNPQPKEVFAKKVVDKVTYALRQVVTSGTGTAAQTADRPLAGKTGTSDNYVSAWFSGYTPQLATSVMVVRQDASGHEISLTGDGGLTTGTGGALPAQIAGAFFNGALAGENVLNFDEPESLYDGTPSAAPTYNYVEPTPTAVAPTQQWTPEPTPTFVAPTTEVPTPTPTPTAPTTEPTPIPTPTSAEPTLPASPTAEPTTAPTATESAAGAASAAASGGAGVSGASAAASYGASPGSTG